MTEVEPLAPVHVYNIITSAIERMQISMDCVANDSRYSQNQEAATGSERICFWKQISEAAYEV